VADPERADEELRAVGGSLELARYRPQLAECRERLRGVASDNGGAEVAAMVREAKLLRATLVLAAGSPLGASSSALIPAAVSIELLHLASLVHDDIIDDAIERRGVPALHVTAGRSRALVVGDLLIVAAFDVLSEVRIAVPAEMFANAVEALSKGAQQCCHGQLAELDPRNHVLSEEDYLDVVAKKTGALFSVAATLGALIAGAGDEELAALATFGTELGSAYQIRDDLRDSKEDEPRRRRAVRSGDAEARASNAVRRALDRVPACCNEALRELVEAMLCTSYERRHGACR
jgi:geranylgeranyl diphosphate synthase, type I